MTQEIELKLRLDPNAAEQLSQWLDEWLGTADQFALMNQYYDTPDARLSRAGCALRVRQKGTRYEQTLKTRGDQQGGISRRGEWNWPLARPALELALLDSADVVQHWPTDVKQADLEPLFTTNFVRRRWVWQQDDQRVELVLDRGEVSAAGKQQPLCELELELLQGDAAVIWSLVQCLVQQQPLWLSDISKAERGFALLGMGRHWQSGGSADDASWLMVAEQRLAVFQRCLEQALWPSGAGLSEASNNPANQQRSDGGGGMPQALISAWLLLLQALLRSAAMAAVLPSAVWLGEADRALRHYCLSGRSHDAAPLASPLLQLAAWLFSQHEPDAQLVAAVSHDALTERDGVGLAPAVQDIVGCHPVTAADAVDRQQQLACCADWLSLSQPLSQ